jgi:hypothetical protein
MMPIVARQVNRESPSSSGAGGAPSVPVDARAARRTLWLVSAGFSAMVTFVATPILVGPLGLDARWVSGIVGGSLAIYASSLVAGHLADRPLGGSSEGQPRPIVSGARRRRASGSRLGRGVAPALATKTH